VYAGSRVGAKDIINTTDPVIKDHTHVLEHMLITNTKMI